MKGVENPKKYWSTGRWVFGKLQNRRLAKDYQLLSLAISFWVSIVIRNYYLLKAIQGKIIIVENMKLRGWEIGLLEIF